MRILIACLLLCAMGSHSFAQSDSTDAKRKEYLQKFNAKKNAVQESNQDEKAPRAEEPKTRRYPNLSDEGHAQFSQTTFVAGLALNSIAFPVFLNATGRQAFGAGLLMGAASYFIPHAIFKNTNINQPMADAFSQTYGRGVFHATLISAELNSDGPTTAGTVMLLPNLEAYSMMALARETNMSEGGVALAKNSHDLMMTYAMMVQLGHLEFNMISPVLAGLGGYGLGYLMNKSDAYTRGDAHMFTTTSLYGSALAAFTMYSFDNGPLTEEKLKTYSIVSVLGGLGGAYIANRWAHQIDLSKNEGVELKYGVLGGALIGLATAALLSPNSSDEYFLLAGSVVGASISGFLFHQKYSGRRRTPKPEF